MSEWIKTSERMPEFGKVVCYITTDNCVQAGHRFNTNIGEYFESYDEGDNLINASAVVYWIELPELPKEIK